MLSLVSHHLVQRQPHRVSVMPHRPYLHNSLFNRTTKRVTSLMSNLLIRFLFRPGLRLKKAFFSVGLRQLYLNRILQMIKLVTRILLLTIHLITLLNQRQYFTKQRKSLLISVFNDIHKPLNNLFPYFNPKIT